MLTLLLPLRQLRVCTAALLDLATGNAAHSAGVEGWNNASRSIATNSAHEISQQKQPRKCESQIEELIGPKAYGASWPNCCRKKACRDRSTQPRIDQARFTALHTPHTPENKLVTGLAHMLSSRK